MPKYTLEMLRATKSLKQKEAAELVGVSRQTWSNWENQRTFPDVQKAKEIGEKFGVDWNDILFFNVNHGFTVKEKQEIG